MTDESSWLQKRKELLAAEKELTQHKDCVNAMRRRLPMVKIDKEYIFTGVDGKRSLLDLFENQTQLVVYHFMFDPAWDKGCEGCTGLIDAIGDLSMLAQRNTAFKVISRAPLPKLLDYKAKKGWDISWHSSFENDFNYDFHVTLDESKAPLMLNYRTIEEFTKEKGRPPGMKQGETHELSTFFRIENEAYHFYSTYGRGCENLTDSYDFLDVTAYGRQEDFEDSRQAGRRNPRMARPGYFAESDFCGRTAV